MQINDKCGCTNGAYGTRGLLPRLGSVI